MGILTNFGNGRFITVFGITALFLGVLIQPALPQTAPGANQTTPDQQKDLMLRPKPPETKDKRVLWIIPNNRTTPTLVNYEPITPAAKFKLSADDAFDRGTVVLAGAFAGIGQLSNSDPSFGQGGAGYGRYFATSYADFVIGDFMTEALYPTLLHQDPRYFRRGRGSVWSRLGYAAGQCIVTHSDTGRTQFNYSEIIGNSTAVAISAAYYPDGRDVSTAVSKLGSQIGVDVTSNILKEFWPDLRRKLSRNRN
jgi:hypothetical protein